MAAGHAVHDLIGEALPHEAGADHSDADRPSLLLAGLERLVDDDHDFPLTAILRLTSGSASARGVHTASFGEISETGSGQVSPNFGSL